MKTQEQTILEHLQLRGQRGLSGSEAADMFRVRDLPKRISVLRSAGVGIIGTFKTDALGQRYMRYSLSEVA